MRVNSSIFDTLSKIASANDEYPRARMAAALVRGNKIMSIGLNRHKSDPLAAKFSKNEDAIYLHAEIHAIKQALRDYSLDDISGADLYVCRVKNHLVNLPNRKYIETWGLAKPCEGCLRAIAEFNIKNVVYSTDTDRVFQIL